MQREEIVAALTALGARLSDRGIDGEVYVVGGAAIAMAFDARRATRDVDAVFEPKQAIYAAADEVGAAGAYRLRVSYQGNDLVTRGEVVRGFRVGTAIVGNQAAKR